MVLKRAANLYHLFMNMASAAQGFGSRLGRSLMLIPLTAHERVGMPSSIHQLLLSATGNVDGAPRGGGGGGQVSGTMKGCCFGSSIALEHGPWDNRVLQRPTHVTQHDVFICSKRGCPVCLFLLQLLRAFQ